MKFAWFVVLFQVSAAVVTPTTEAIATLAQTPNPPLMTTTTTISTSSSRVIATDMSDKSFKIFIEQVENLVLNTTEQALKATANVYRSLRKSIPPLFQHAIEPIASKYLRQVDETLKNPRNYYEQRKLLRCFRLNNMQIERLMQELRPQNPKFEFHLLSKDFYHASRNVTELDNIYLKFMLAFQRLSDTLWDTMSEEVVEQQQDLLEILDEIANERELSEKDKLYDEFIETFLFKTEANPTKNCKSKTY